MMSRSELARGQWQKAACDWVEKLAATRAVELKEAMGLID